MHKKIQSNNSLEKIIRFVLWVAGILVSLAVGFGMVQTTLTIPFIHASITSAVGWIVVILTILGAVLAIINQLSN